MWSTPLRQKSDKQKVMSNMNLFKLPAQGWRRLSITRKFTVAFGVLLLLIVVVALTGYLALATVQRETESAIVTSTTLQRLVLTMDAGLQRARLQQRDFFLRWPNMGFATARTTYADANKQQIVDLIQLSTRLRAQIAQLNASAELSKSNVDLNFYLSAAQRYGASFEEAVALVEQLASAEVLPATGEPGLQAQLAQRSAQLYELLQTTGDLALIAQYREMQAYEKDYLVTRQRPQMQRALNAALPLRNAITDAADFQPAAREEALATLDQYLAIADAIVKIDVEINSHFNEFDLQAAAVDPIGAELVRLASSEVERAREQIANTNQLAVILLIIAVVAAVLLAILIAWVLNNSITRNVVKLTAAAGALRNGDLTTRAQIDSPDELGQLADSFNTMAGQLQTAFNTLQASEAKYRSLFEDSNDAIFITTPDGKLIDMNPAGFTLFGMSSAIIGTLNVQDLYVNPEDRFRFRQEVEQNAAVTDFETTMQKHDGSHFDALITATLRHSDDGGEVGYQGIIRDITLQKHNEHLRAENLRLGTELEVTQRLQQMILPKAEELLEIEGLEIAAYMDPADEVGGDYYDVLQHNGQVKIGIGDVTGHGLESGVLMLMTQMGVRTLLTNNEVDPVNFLAVLNRTLYHNVQRMEIDKNLSLSLLNYTPYKRENDQENGGRVGGQLKMSGQHEELIVVRQGGEIELIDTMPLGFPVGLDDEIADYVSEATIELEPGDGVVLYTDGITEAENSANEQYGMDRLCETIRQHWAGSAEAVKTAVIDDVRLFIGAQTVFDDITLLVLKQK